MNKFIKGMTYKFHRNLGKKDRIIRTLIALGGIGAWYFGAIAGVIGAVVAVFGIMLLGTAISSRCTITYLSNANTMNSNEKSNLDKKGIKYEK